MLTTEQYRQLIEDSLAALPFPSEPSRLAAPVRYALSGGGKRLRPMLTLAAAQACGADPLSAMAPAMAIEVYHNFTLLHDDVMDHADLRRGRPTVHRKWDEATAILCGDAMLTFASQMLATGAEANPARFVAMNSLFNSTAIDVDRGQQYDLDFEERTDVTEAEYIEMIRLKTSVLLACACRLGAMAAGASAEVADAFYAYGEKLGIAFQLRDDYLDTYGDVEFFGKEVGGDILNDKKTWLSIMAMADERSAGIKQLFGPADDPAAKIASVRSLYDRAGLPDRILALIARYSADADSELERAGLAPEALDFFRRLTARLCSRVV